MQKNRKDHIPALVEQGFVCGRLSKARYDH